MKLHEITELRKDNIGLRGDQIVIMDPITDEFSVLTEQAVYITDI